MASVAKTDRGINDDVVGFTAWCADYIITDFSVYALDDGSSANTAIQSNSISSNYIILENNSDGWNSSYVEVGEFDNEGNLIATHFITRNCIITCDAQKQYRIVVSGANSSNADTPEDILNGCGIRILATERLNTAQYAGYSTAP